MASTKRVPATYHSELSEYASLLRAIRTTSTLDIVPQLSKVNPHVGTSDCVSDQGASEEDPQLTDPDTLRDASMSTEDGNMKAGSKRRAKNQISSARTKRRKRKGDEDHWTRWPLLEEHCPLPEWTFDEEIMAIVEHCLRVRSSSSQRSNVGENVATLRTKDPEGDDDLNDFTLSPAHLSGLTSEVASKLTSIFALLASHRPSATFTKHGRLAPMSWLDVLEVAGVAGIFDLATVEVVKERMETIFGPSQSQIVSCMQVLEASKRALADAEASFGLDLSTIGPPPRRRREKQKATPMPVDGE
ncbi:hypothetical protein JB92DRAFT_2885991 [Gautieria morchelliformis]|nr:hypothetical protein JB92DRAFT_2885991 [Gautieria morchelliformis]